MFIALIGVVAAREIWQLNTYVIPLILGVIGGALSDDDSNTLGKIKLYIMALACFAFASFSVEILMPYPWIFAAGLAGSTFVFILIGAIGPRYSTLAFSSLLIAIYTMMGSNGFTNIWLQPSLLLLGAAWYFAISFAWHLLSPMHPIERELANIFMDLSSYIDSKSEWFYPTTKSRSSSHSIQESKFNAKIVSSLNRCKTLLLNRTQQRGADNRTDAYLSTYFIAQDIHERFSSSHIEYRQIAAKFYHSDVMFRFKYLLQSQAQACRSIARSLIVGKQYQHSHALHSHLHEVEQSLNYLEKHSPSLAPELDRLKLLYKNLGVVEALQSQVAAPDDLGPPDRVLYISQTYSWPAMYYRIRQGLRLESAIFRHAVRLSLAFLVGYGVQNVLGLQHGFWILLTILFVCQPNYSATKHKIVARVIGTIAGLLTGLPLLYLFPSPEGQLTMIVISGVLFFAFRVRRYGLATLFITLLVLFCSTQLGEGFDVVLPRLIDTLLGSIIAASAITYILPSWQSHKLMTAINEAINSNRNYLNQVMAQYQSGRQNDLDYRVSRRHAHDKDATLTQTVCDMMAEPGKHQFSPEDSFQLLTSNHALLSYISTLGAHREQLTDASALALLSKAHRIIDDRLTTLTDRPSQQTQSSSSIEKISDEVEKNEIEANEIVTDSLETNGVERHLSFANEPIEPATRNVLQQLLLMQKLMPRLAEIITQLPDEKRR